MVDRSIAELDGLTAVVTGSSSGIGRAIVLELAAAGAACVVHANRSKDKAEAVAAEIRRSGPEAIVLKGDVSKDDDRRRLVEQAAEWRGTPYIWVNNAGADVLTGEAASWSFEKKLERLWEVDVVGTVALSRAVGAAMKASGRGVIINIGWDQAEQGMAGDSGELFAATKGAVMAFTKSLSQSLAPEVRVNCVAPGWIKTSWGEGASEYWQTRAREESLVGRWGVPEDIASAVRFLASPAASFITGQTLLVNGGFKRSSA